MKNIKPTYQELENQITELKEQNKILTKPIIPGSIKQNTYSKIIDNITSIIVIIDSEGLIKYQSPSIEKNFGWKPEDLIGIEIYKHIHHSYLDQAKEFIETILSSPSTVKTTEFKYKCKDGTYKWIEFTCSNLLHDPEISGLIGNYHDITTFKKAEEFISSANEELRVNEEELKEINHQLLKSDKKLIELNQIFEVYKSSVPIIVTRINEDGVYTHSSGSGLERWKLKEDQLVGLNIFEVYPQIKEKIENTLINKIQETFVYEGQSENGTIYYQNYFLPDKARKKGMIAIAIDITEHKQIEIELIKAKKAAETNDRLKSAFLANMSHEIRTPMNGILGFSNLLKNPELSGEQITEFVDIINKAGKRMLNTINDIVSISKIESDLMEVDFKESNINDQMTYIYSFFKLEIKSKGLEFIYNNNLPSNEVNIKTDVEKVYAILTNLVKNAIKYTEEGFIEIGYTQNNNFIEFYVKDTGKGISKERHKTIFERFTQNPKDDMHTYNGVGLGLSISKAYVEMIGGKIWVESEKEKGSTFYFTLPCNNKEAKEETSPEIESFISTEVEENNKLKILIVEDDEISQEFVTIAVKNLAKEIIHTESGSEAVEVCSENPDIDLILMDIKLPGLNGLEATKQIREFNKNVKIIAQTAYAIDGDKKKVIDAGCNDYISKPIDKDQLIQKINTCIKN